MVHDWLQPWVETSVLREYEIKRITYHLLHIFSHLKLCSWPLQWSPDPELQLCGCVSGNRMSGVTIISAYQIQLERRKRPFLSFIEVWNFLSKCT